MRYGVKPRAELPHRESLVIVLFGIARIIPRIDFMSGRGALESFYQ
jgi:hypothetical protein